MASKVDLFRLEYFKKASQRERDYVFGYLRRAEKEFNSITIPMLIYQICTVYCMVYDKWDRKWTHKAYNIIDDYILKMANCYSNSSTSAFLSTIVNEGVHCWEFEIIKKGSWLRFGIIIADETKYAEIRDFWFGCKVKTAYIWDYAYQKIINHDVISWGKSYGKQPKNGDKIVMYLDFNKATLSFSVNEESLGIAHNIDATKQYRAGAQLYKLNDEIKLISYHQLL